MAKILIIDAFELGGFIAPYNEERNAFVYNQELLTLFADCVAKNIAVKLLLPKSLKEIHVIAVNQFRDIVGNVKNKLPDKTKAELVSQEFTDKIPDRIAGISLEYEQTLLITANDKLMLKNVNIFIVDPTDKEAGPLTIDLIREVLFHTQESDDETSEDGRQSPPLRLFEGLGPEPTKPGSSGNSPSYHQH